MEQIPTSLRLKFCLPSRIVPQIETESRKNANFVLTHLNLCTEIHSYCASCNCLKLTAKAFFVHHSSSVAITLL